LFHSIGTLACARRLQVRREPPQDRGTHAFEAFFPQFQHAHLDDALRPAQGAL